MAKELAEKKEQLPSTFLTDLAADANRGFEGISAKDVAIPYVLILQSLSPQVKKGDHKIPGAEEGDIFNTVSRNVVKGALGINVIPCAFQKRWVEWVSRDAGGGFVKSHEEEKILESTRKNDKNQDILPSGNMIVTTAYYYVIIVNADGGYERAIISMTSTQLKKSRRWNAQMMAIQLSGSDGKKFTPPTFSHQYTMSTIQESKDSYAWSGWEIGSPKILTDANLYQAAKKFSLDVLGGKVETTPPTEEGRPESAASESNF